VVRPDGTKEWYSNGKLYRKNDNPVIVYADGTKVWCKENGIIHRDNGHPAIIKIDGSRFWYIDGKCIQKEN
jgi:protein associated with RNAse G/E